VKLRCYLLCLLRIHRPYCERCNAREIYGDEMRKRLEELNWRTQPRSLNNEDHGEAVKVFDSKPEVGASSATSR
jgi:alpha-D-ribose 1-methylphosphonate 5-phosphate C-P lyase